MKFFYGQRIWFSNEKRPYRIRAFSENFAVCTKPFNIKKTVFYTIIDLNRKVRGAENLIFCAGFETDEQCKEAIERLLSKETEVSYRNFVKLDIVKFDEFPQ